MTLFAVEGVAGCGKTFRLMGRLAEALNQMPLADGQRVLALTFMHGARRRLNEKLHEVPGLGRRFECVTVDGFALNLLKRWRTLAAVLGIPHPGGNVFDQQCDAVGALLERPDVRSWIAASYPIVVVDEAQDLKPQRLRIVRALTQSVNMLVAADDFQCLDQALRPNPLVSWMRESCEPEMLNQVRRTNVAALLTAAAAIRAGNAPVGGQRLGIFTSQGVPMAAAYLANAIAWRQGGRVAVITPSQRAGFVTNVVQRVCAQACGAQGNGPYRIQWERSETDEANSLIGELNVAAVSTLADALAAIAQAPQSKSMRATGDWMRRQARVTGKTEFSRAEIEEVVTRQVSLRRQRRGADAHDFVAMTVQQAKNREFEGVVVLWPYQVGGDAEHKRRLLYNALTRAQRWCTIILQGPQLLQAPPFQ